MSRTAVLSFDPNGPSPEDTKVSVQPRRNLAKRQTVQIKVTDALPGSLVVRQCARSSKTEVNQETCRVLDWSETKGLNKPSKLSVSVSRYLDNDNLDNDKVDCALAEFSCVIQVETGGGYYPSDEVNSQLMKLVAITFENEPPADRIPPVALRISPNTALPDDSVVSVSGPAPAELQPIILIQCSLTNGGGVATCNNEIVEYLEAPSPDWELEMTVVRRFSDGGEDIDCLETAVCALVAFEFLNEVRPFARSGYLTFDAFQALDTAAAE